MLTDFRSSIVSTDKPTTLNYWPRSLSAEFQKELHRSHIPLYSQHVQGHKFGIEPIDVLRLNPSSTTFAADPIFSHDVRYKTGLDDGVNDRLCYLQPASSCGQVYQFGIDFCLVCLLVECSAGSFPEIVDVDLNRVDANCRAVAVDPLKVPIQQRTNGPCDAAIVPEGDQWPDFTSWLFDPNGFLEPQHQLFNLAPVDKSMNSTLLRCVRDGGQDACLDDLIDDCDGASEYFADLAGVQPGACVEQRSMDYALLEEAGRSPS